MKLQTEENLRAVANQVIAHRTDAPWRKRVAEFLSMIESAPADVRQSEDFHKLIWEDNPISGLGMGTVHVEHAVGSPDFRSWFAKAVSEPLPDGQDERLAHVEALYSDLKKRVTAPGGRTPLVKMMRVMAAFFPRDFTTICSNSAAIDFHRALFGVGRRRTPVRRQFEISQRLSQVLGPVEASIESIADRMTLAWRIHDRVKEQADEPAEMKEETPGELELVPLPAAQRRKGLTSIGGGGINALLNATNYVADGVSKEELIDHLRSEFPEYRESSIKTLFNVLKNEFRVIEQKGDTITPTARGQSMLDSNEVEELFPILLTRVLGFDAALVHVRDNPRIEYPTLLTFLRTINPGWTTTFAPSSLVKWLVDFKLIEVDKERRCQLTQLGEEWTSRVHWTPQPLQDFVLAPAPAIIVEAKPLAFDVKNSNLAGIIEAVNRGGLKFSEDQVRRLHLGLWSDARRHFAVLAGLSGSGKTALATRYAHAFSDLFGPSLASQVFVQAVEPGWHDSTPLFGYVNPLDKERRTYIRPEFLDFMLRASANPDRPHFIVLDEMNLSHPEQYLSPLLSSMESGEPIRLHNEGAAFDGAPPLIPYPLNLAIIGTVNMDETTHGLSDKVLDRAFTMEFWDIDLNQYPGWNRDQLPDIVRDLARKCLTDLMLHLAPVRLHFGWRTVDQVLSYLAQANASGFDVGSTTLLDEVVYARLLPKLRGTESERMQRAMDGVISALKEHGLLKSAEKATQLSADLRQTGMMRFWA